MADPRIAVYGGVDTHLDVNVAAALDGVGSELGVESFPTTTAGYVQSARVANQLGAVTALRSRRHPAAIGAGRTVTCSDCGVAGGGGR